MDWKIIKKTKDGGKIVTHKGIEWWIFASIVGFVFSMAITIPVYCSGFANIFVFSHLIRYPLFFILIYISDDGMDFNKEDEDLFFMMFGIFAISVTLSLFI